MVHDVPGEIEHVLGHFDVLDIVEIFFLGADLVGIAQQRSHGGLCPKGSSEMMCSRLSAQPTQSRPCSSRGSPGRTLSLSRPPRRRRIAHRDRGGAQRDQMAPFVRIASLLRTLLGARFEFMDRRRLWSPHNAEGNGHFSSAAATMSATMATNVSPDPSSATSPKFTHSRTRWQFASHAGAAYVSA